MSFREKSAWLMALLMTGAGLYYLYLVRGASQALGATAPPAVVIAFVLLLVIGAIVGQTVLPFVAPRKRPRRPTNGSG